MSAGEALTRWTVRLALLLYVLALAGRLTGRTGPARSAWAAGCLAFLAHVACAFHFFHGWSHPAAYEETARQTAELTGTASGFGLYLNYGFTLLWVADALWWWARPTSYLSRSWWIELPVQGFFAFLALNATVVFESGPVRWAGVLACLVLGTLAARRIRKGNAA
jgi:hypothetical protein